MDKVEAVSIELPQQPGNLAPDILLRFDHLADLSPAKLTQLARQVRMEEVGKGTCLLDQGSTERITLYLLEGEVELLALDGNKRILRAIDDSARRPISRLRPSQYRVTALTEVVFLTVDSDILEAFISLDGSSSLQQEESHLPGDSYRVVESELGTSIGNPVMARVYRDLAQGRLVVPTMAAVAEHVGRAIFGAGRDPHRLSSLLMLDPALAAKAINSVNCRLRGAQKPVSTCHSAVESLGTQGVISLVMNCVLRETLRNPRPALGRRMQAWWERSLRVSAASYALAQELETFDPDLAALCGLLHRLGEAILLQAANELDEPVSEANLDQTIAENTHDIGLILMTIWNLPQEVVTVVAEAGNLMRDHSHDADYADIVLLAEQYSAPVTEQADVGLAPEQMPAFRRLGLAALSPESARSVREAADGALDKHAAVLPVC